MDYRDRDRERELRRNRERAEGMGRDDDWARMVPEHNRHEGPYRNYGWEAGQSGLPEFRDPSIHYTRQEMDRIRRLGDNDWRDSGNTNWEIEDEWDEDEPGGRFRWAGRERYNYATDFDPRFDERRPGRGRPGRVGGRYGAEPYRPGRWRDDEDRFQEPGRSWADYPDWGRGLNPRSREQDWSQGTRYEDRGLGEGWDREWGRSYGSRRMGRAGRPSAAHSEDTGGYGAGYSPQGYYGEPGYGGGFDEEGHQNLRGSWNAPGPFDRPRDWREPGPYTGVGPRNYTRSDERIQEEVCERLTQHGELDASGITVEVHQGQITLTGDVNSRHDRRLAEDIAESVSGVIDIHNQLNWRQGGMEGRRASQGPNSQENRVDPVGHSGVYPASGPLPEGKAKAQGMASWGQGERGAEGYQDHGESELPMNEDVEEEGKG